MLFAIALLACTTPVERTPPAYYGPEVLCDEGVAPGSDPTLLRWPYLQNVTQRAATVAWGGPAGSERGVLTIEDAQGKVVSKLANSDTIPLAPGKPMRLFHARVEQLEPGQSYCYRVSVDGRELAGALGFRTAPESAAAPVKFLVIGDFGAGTDEQLELAQVLEQHAKDADLLFTTGDNAYNSGTWQELHERVFQPYQHLFMHIPVYPTSGNHDYSTDDAAPYLANFFLPRDAWRPQDAERYYSLRWGPLHWVGLDTENPLREIREDESDDMKDWLVSTLEQSDRPWPLVGFHKPPYTGHATRAPDILVRLLLVPAFEQLQLPLVLSGHNHFYERSLPMIQDNPVDQGGVTYVITAGGGRHLYPQLDAPHHAHRAQEHHFLVGTADACNLEFTAINIWGEEIDRFGFRRC